MVEPFLREIPNSRHSEAIVSPSLSRITNRIRSSITELSFHGISSPAPFGPKSVTHVSGTFCYLCLGTDTDTYELVHRDLLHICCTSYFCFQLLHGVHHHCRHGLDIALCVVLTPS